MEIGRVNILVDLDQTLVSALTSDEFKPKDHKEKMMKFSYKNMDGYYTVFERPYLQEFLDYIFREYNVSVWTAASKDYALFIIDKILLPKNKLERNLDFIFFSYHCNWSKRVKKGTKDLSMLWDVHKLSGYHKGNTIILDDYKEVKKTQPGNCIVAVPFEFLNKDSKDDTFLRDVIPKLESMKTIMLSAGPDDSVMIVTE